MTRDRHCGRHHNDSANNVTPACKPGIRFASFRGEADSGCWLIGRFVGRERRSHIARAWKGVSACSTVLRSPASGGSRHSRPWLAANFERHESFRTGESGGCRHPAAAADARNPFVHKPLRH